MPIPAAAGLTADRRWPTIEPVRGRSRDGENPRGERWRPGEGRVGLKDAGRERSHPRPVSSAALRVALLYDMDDCYVPTGVTRHALAQLERLARRPEIALTVLTGRMTPPGRPGLLGVAGAALAARASAAHSRPAAMVANQALAADRMVDRAGRLDLLPGRVLRARRGRRRKR